MEQNRSNSKRPKLYVNLEDSDLTSSSTAVKIQEIRQQLEGLLSNARGKKIKKPPLKKLSISTISNQYCGQSLSITDVNLSKRYDPLRIKTSSKTNKLQKLRDQYVKSLSISDSSSRITKVDSYENDSEMIPADAKLTAYKKFIDSLSRVIQDSYQASPDSVAISLHSPTKSIEEKETFLIEKNNFGPPNPYANTKAQRAEKTTYCRPVVQNHDALKSTERNAKLQLLVRKLVEAREKEKQAEAWNNYINELKNKHGCCEISPRRPPRMCSREDERPDIIDDGYKYAGRQTGKRPSLRELLFNDLYGASSSLRPDSSFQRRTWGEPSSCKAYKYKNNSFCLPMSSQARLLAMKRERCCRYGGSRPRYFRGSSIIVEKELSNERNLRVRSQEASGKADRPEEADLWECRAIQTGGFLYISENSKECQISEKNSKLERITSFADQLRHKLRPSKSNNNNRSLHHIEEKLDVLIDSFNGFMKEMKSKKLASDVKSAGVSCSSINQHENIQKAKSDTMSLFNKGRSIICEMAQHHPRSTVAFPCPINQHTIDEIMNEERDKNEKVKRDIDELLNNNGKCAVKIMIDIPTKEHSTEVTRSFYKAQQEETIIEEMEPIEAVEGKSTSNTPDSRYKSPANNNMTIAVNTEPLGLLALFRISTDTVKQILSYMPNLDYASYLARKQVSQAAPVARYVCNICGAAFAQPSMLSDHIQEHNLPSAKNCCVCRHVLDRLGARSGMFACAHCGQVFTRAYCRQLHEQCCPLAPGGRERTSSLMMLS